MLEFQPKEIFMTLRDKSDANSQQAIPVASAVKVNLVRRRLLIGSAVVGIGGVAAAAIHDGELGGPSQTHRGAVPWQEGTADAPPGVSGSGYVYFTPAEVAFIEAAVGTTDSRMIRSGPAPSKRTCLSFWIGNSPASSGSGDHYYPRRSLAQGHAGTGLSKPLQPRAAVSRGHCGDRQVRRREFQRRRTSASSRRTIRTRC